jgi:hypothetical protein
VVDKPVETQPDAKRKRSVLKITKSKRAPDVATTTAMDHILKILEDHLGTDNSWEASAIFAGHKEPVRGDMAKSPILLMCFLSGPKHGQKFERYDFWDIDSVVAFWLEQLGIKPVMVQGMRSRAKYGSLWMIVLGQSLTKEVIECLPHGLVKLGHGIGFTLTVPSRITPRMVGALIEPLFHMISCTEVQQALVLESQCHLVTTNITRINAHRVPTGWVKCDLEVISQSLPIECPFTIPTGLSYPESLDTFMLEMTVKGCAVKITRRMAYLAYGDETHLWEECQHTQRLVGCWMPNFMFVTRLEVPGDDPPPAVMVAATNMVVGKAGEMKGGAPQKVPLGKKSSKQPKKKDKGKGKAP